MHDLVEARGRARERREAQELQAEPDAPRKRPGAAIPTPLSVHLDLLRVIACITVVIFHGNLRPMTGQPFDFLYGTDAVIVFFVLSGFVIRYVAEDREPNLPDFLIARLSRLWSVLWPALLITAGLDCIGMSISDEIYRGWGAYAGYDWPVLRLLAAGLFVNELWFVSVAPLSNGPTWSIGFEFWYYMLFATAFFGRGRRWRWPAMALLVAIVGPKILLLMPPWLMGAWLYRHRQTIEMRRAYAWIAAAGPVAVFFILHPLSRVFLAMTATALSPAFVVGWLKYADNFVWYNLVGGLVAVHIGGMIVLLRGAELPDGATRLIRAGAGLTFSIYLLHYPMQVLLATLTRSWGPSAGRTILVIVVSLVASALVGHALEPLKGGFRRGLTRLAGRERRRGEAAEPPARRRTAGT